MVNLKVEIKMKDWVKPMMDDISETLKVQAERGLIHEKTAVELINEIARSVAKYGTEVNGPVYFNPYTHEMQIPNTTQTGGGNHKCKKY